MKLICLIAINAMLVAGGIRLGWDAIAADEHAKHVARVNADFESEKTP